MNDDRLLLFLEAEAKNSVDFMRAAQDVLVRCAEFHLTNAVEENEKYKLRKAEKEAAKKEEKDKDKGKKEK